MSFYCLTLDMDWAPNWMLEDCLRTLVDNHVAATWFVTHVNPVLEELRRRPDLFELGIHPNCLPGSTHGENEDQILGHLLEIVPEAVSMRTHALYQSTPFLARASKAGVRNDASLFLPWATGLKPHHLPFGEQGLMRLPYFWEDDVAMLQPASPWQVERAEFHGDGLKIFDFHPVHVVLNTRDPGLYDKLKTQRPIQEWTRGFLSPHVSSDPGPGTLFTGLVRFLARGDVQSDWTIQRLACLEERS